MFIKYLLHVRYGIGDVLIQFEMSVLNKNTTDFVHIEKLENNIIKYETTRGTK